MRRRCGGLDFGRSIAPAFLRSANRDLDENGPHAKGIPSTPVTASISQLRQRLSRDSRTAFVLSGGGNQSVAQVGMLARPARARHRPRRDRRVLRRCVQRRHHRGRAEPPRGRAARGDLGVAPRRGGVPRGPPVPGLEPPHPRRPPLLQPGPARHPRTGRHPRHVRRAGDPVAGGRRRPRHRRRGGVLLRPARARPARQRRAPGHLPADPPRRPHPGRRRGRRHRARCGTHWRGRSTGST